MPHAVTRPTDFLVRDEGSIFLVEPVSAAAFAHVTELRAQRDEVTWCGDALAVEHRFVPDVAASLIEEGFVVRRGAR
jgi:hypothetical protein